jgi:hypothetical protein
MFEIQTLIERHVVCKDSAMCRYAVDLDKWWGVGDRREWQFTALDGGGGTKAPKSALAWSSKILSVCPVCWRMCPGFISCNTNKFRPNFYVCFREKERKKAFHSIFLADSKAEF